MKKWLLLLTLASCAHNDPTIHPKITQPLSIEHSTTPVIAPLSLKDKQHAWGQEIVIGKSFAQESDFYRAITSFKRAKALLPESASSRLPELNYNIFLSYYLGKKYELAINFFEKEALLYTPESFIAFESLLVMAHHCYLELNEVEKADAIVQRLGQKNINLSSKLHTFRQIRTANLPVIANISSLQNFYTTYEKKKKSVKRAENLNALLPGAGYWYVGQKKTAFTSFAINAIFIATTYQLFHKGYIAPAIFTLSLEMGWYFGGINGAGRAAREYNEYLYAHLAKPPLHKDKLFPIFSIEHAF